MSPIVLSISQALSERTGQQAELQRMSSTWSHKNVVSRKKTKSKRRRAQQETTKRSIFINEILSLIVDPILAPTLAVFMLGVVVVLTLAVSMLASWFNVSVTATK